MPILAYNKRKRNEGSLRGTNWQNHPSSLGVRKGSDWFGIVRIGSEAGWDETEDRRSKMEDGGPWGILAVPSYQGR